MALDSIFLSSVIERYNSSGELDIYITDNAPGIIASSGSCSSPESIPEISRYILNLQKPSVISSNQDNGINTDDTGSVIFGTPIYNNGKIWGTVLILGNESNARNTGPIIKAAIETVLIYENSSISSINKVDEKSRLAFNVLSQSSERKSVTAEMNRLELDLNRIRSAIVIKLNHHQNKYFNINLNLGYQSAIEANIKKAIELIKRNKFMNNQDLSLSYDNNTLIIFKSFLPHDNISKVYLSLDSICNTLADELIDFKTAFDYKIAYGNLYPDIMDIKKSFQEALDMITIGSLSDNKTDLYLLNHLIFENLSHDLHPQMKNKVIIPIIHQLSRDNIFSSETLISCCEAFVDCCMNFSETTRYTGLHRNTIRMRLKKLKSLTGLDPVNKFSDAFLIKLIAVYLKQNGIKDGRVAI